MTDHQHEPLTPQGAARREAMLGELTESLVRVHRARRMRQRVATIACLSLVLIIAWRVTPVLTPNTHERFKSTTIQYVKIDEMQRTTPPLSPPNGVLQSAAPVTSICTFEQIKTDSTVLARATTQPTTADVRFELLTDNDLLAALAAINRPAGLIRVGDQVRLSAAVTDRELESRERQLKVRGDRLKG